MNRSRLATLQLVILFIIVACPISSESIALASISNPAATSAASSTAVSATTTTVVLLDSLYEQVAALSAEIKALEASSSSAAVAATSTEPCAPLILTHSLSLGSTGSDVTQLQQFLQSQGYYTYPSITGPQQDLNLGIQAYLNGTLTSNIVIDTSEPATDTIDYVATDQNGLTSTSTRTVIIEAPASTPSDDSDADDAATSTLPANVATTTDATTPAQ